MEIGNFTRLDTLVKLLITGKQPLDKVP